METDKSEFEQVELACSNGYETLINKLKEAPAIKTDTIEKVLKESKQCYNNIKENINKYKSNDSPQEAKINYALAKTERLNDTNYVNQAKKLWETSIEIDTLKLSLLNEKAKIEQEKKINQELKLKLEENEFKRVNAEENTKRLSTLKTLEPSTKDVKDVKDVKVVSTAVKVSPVVSQKIISSTKTITSTDSIESEQSEQSDESDETPVTNKRAQIKTIKRILKDRTPLIFEIIFYSIIMLIFGIFGIVSIYWYNQAVKDEEEYDYVSTRKNMWLLVSIVCALLVLVLIGLLIYAIVRLVRLNKK